MKASSSPVTTALPSPIVIGRFSASSESTSAARQAATLTAWTSRLRQPKIQTEATAAGASATTTHHMTFAVLAESRRCGEAETTKRSLIAWVAPFPHFFRARFHLAYFTQCTMGRLVSHTKAQAPHSMQSFTPYSSHMAKLSFSA